MTRDYTKLRTFEYADELALAVYNVTAKFPRNEMFSLTAQMRRAGLSVPANIVEGSHRESEKDFLNFLTIALGSLAELGYYLMFARKIGYLSQEDYDDLSQKHTRCIKSLQALITSLRNRNPRLQRPRAEEQTLKSDGLRPETED